MNPKREPPITAADFQAMQKKKTATKKATAYKRKMQVINGQFQLKLIALEIEFVTEYKFNPIRKWRADYFFPSANLALEIEGGAFTNGRHTRGKGFVNDMEKYNAMTLQGIKLLRYTPDQLNQPTTINNILELCKQN